MAKTLGETVEKEGGKEATKFLYLDKKNKVYRVLEVNTSPDLGRRYLGVRVPDEIADGIISNYKILRLAYLKRDGEQIQEVKLLESSHFNDPVIGLYQPTRNAQDNPDSALAYIEEHRIPPPKTLEYPAKVVVVKTEKPTPGPMPSDNTS